MKRSLLISFVSAAVLTASAYASTVDFSAYSPGAVIGTSTSGTGTSVAVLQDGSGDTEFSLYQGFTGGSTAETSATVYSGAGGNYARMLASIASPSGRPWSHVSTTTAFNPLASGQTVEWHSKYTISGVGDSGAIRTGLFAYNAIGSGNAYTIGQTQSVTTGIDFAVAICVSFQINSNNIQITRTNSSGTLQYWDSGSSSWVGFANAATWSLDTAYDVAITADTTAGTLTLTLTDETNNSVVSTAVTAIDELGSSAVAGGLRLSTGNLENNSSSGWTFDLDEVSYGAVPEPAEYALMLGMVVVLGAWLRRRR
ncbi:MAG: PEP-CTERM sorting domain-containing protein [Verrucomicrobiota bacterium JB024]|nr:PEP-CTERM sorting domain-containing protein [Verrucomicrobiota bacterium JB024]